MLNTSNSIIICWAIFLIYWVLNWKSVKPTKEVIFRQRNFQWTILWIVLLLVIVSRSFIPSFSTHIFKDTTTVPALQPLGILLTIIGLIIAIAARKTLADNWSADVELKKDHKLITTGIYKYVRHPIYTGITIMGIGTICALQSIYSVIFYTVMIGFLIYKLKKEETLLLKHFPIEYPDYMKKTKALIPFIY
jgi:protein-S-isoprenylcysteine O-methyltransferase Ste14